MIAYVDILHEAALADRSSAVSSESSAVPLAAHRGDAPAPAVFAGPATASAKPTTRAATGCRILDRSHVVSSASSAVLLTAHRDDAPAPTTPAGPATASAKPTMTAATR